METRRRPRSPASAMFPTRSRYHVHDVFPLSNKEIHPVLRISGRRPAYPFPFTAPVSRERRAPVMRELERDWDIEANRQIEPTLGSIARAIQWRAVLMVANGWRRSRRTGTWIFMGDEPSSSALRKEREVKMKVPNLSQNWKKQNLKNLTKQS